MLKNLNRDLENLGEGLRGKIKYDFDFDFDTLDFLKLKFRKDFIKSKHIFKNLYKKLK